MSALAQFGPARQTEASLAEQRLREAQKLEAIGRLVSGVAHDFNNLLTGIVLCSDLLLAGLEKDNRLRRYAQEIRAAGAQGAGLIQQLMAVARPRTVEAHWLSCNEIIAEMRNLLSRLIGENIELITELADNLALVKMDKTQIEQIVLNLVLNARDAMPDGGRITVCTRNCQELAANSSAEPNSRRHIELEIRDTGCGMDAETRSRVFEPFFTTKKPGKGTGLGLSTVIGIAQQQQGTVEIESAPGLGTRVVVRLLGIAADSQAMKTSGSRFEAENSAIPER